MSRPASKRRQRGSHDLVGLIPPEELFVRPGEETVVEPSPPMTEEEGFRERVAIAWHLVKTTRFYEHEHERLREVLVAMIEHESCVDRRAR